MLKQFQRVLGVWFLAGPLLGASAASAQSDDVAAAANAFGQAQRAELSGDSARAAELYELADGIAPTPEALRSAARAWLNANRLVPAATDAEELIRRYGNDPASRQLADEILGRARPQLGRFQVDCTPHCTLNVDGLAVATEARPTHTVYVAPGPHTLVARFEAGETRKQRLDAHAGDSQQIQLAPEPDSTAPVAPATGPEAVAPSAGTLTASTESPPSSRKLSPAYFWVALSATAAVGAVTIWSGIDLLNARDDFEKDDSPTRKAFDAGEDKDLRTSILIGSTAALAVTTAVLAFFTDFKGSHGGTDSASNHGPRRRAQRTSGESATTGEHAPVWGFGTSGRGGQFVVRKAF